MSKREFERFEQWAASEGRSIKPSNPDYAPRPYVSAATNNALDGWQAALSTRKPYGYGVVNKDGNAESEIVMSESGANLFQKAMAEHTGEWSARGPFRVVELFYEDQS